MSQGGDEEIKYCDGWFQNVLFYAVLNIAKQCGDGEVLNFVLLCWVSIPVSIDAKSVKHVAQEMPEL